MKGKNCSGKTMYLRSSTWMLHASIKYFCRKIILKFLFRDDPESQTAAQQKQTGFSSTGRAMKSNFIRRDLIRIILRKKNIVAELRSHPALTAAGKSVTKLFFYGSGCSEPTLNAMIERPAENIFSFGRYSYPERSVCSSACSIR